MRTEFHIEGASLQIDIAATQSFYRSQKLIIDSCECSDCLYYFETFTKLPLKIFSIVREMGADLQKNLDAEPTGVWCIRYPEEQFVHCEQMYCVVGSFSEVGVTEAHYKESELGYQVRASFYGAIERNDFIHIWISIDKIDPTLNKASLEEGL